MTELIFAADHHFVIGKQHTRNGVPCEDYADSHAEDGRAFAIVSDGCSSGARTDIGSRIIVNATRHALLSHIPLGVETTPKLVREAQDAHIRVAHHSLGLSPKDLLASACYVALEGESVLLSIDGDGVVAWQKKDGTIEAIKVEWSGNMPFYPSYRIFDCKAFVIAREQDAEAGVMYISRVRISHVGIEEIDAETRAVANIDSCSYTALLPIAASELRAIAVFTDGVFQVSHRDWVEMIVALFGFKNTCGEFAKRRMIRFLEDERKDGHEPMDDVAFAAIVIDEREKGDQYDEVEFDKDPA